MGGRRRKNLSKMGETAKKGKEKAKEDQSRIVSSNIDEVKQKNKEIAEAPQVNIASHPQFFGYQDFDPDHGYGFDYDYDGMGFDDIDFSDPFSYDDYTDPLRYDEDGNYRGDYSHWGGDQRHWAEFYGYPIPGYQDEEDEEEEDDEEEVEDDFTYEMAILQKEEDEQIEKPMNIGVMSNLPSEVLFDILSRLPVKTLARCRCVCKDIHRITHIRRFIQMHHNRAIQGDIPPSVLLHARYCIDELPNDLYLLQNDTCDDTLDGRAVVANPQFSTLKKFEVVGSCNGLLCLAEPRHYGPRFVCNPVTGEYISLPKPDKHTDFDIVSGFGYDEVANEYKVVRMLFRSVDLDCGSGTSTFKLEGEVYSLSLGYWRHIGDAPYALRGKPSSAFVNGALHWVTDELRELIVSFDLGREEFRVVPPPPGFVPGCRSHSLNLGVLEEHLCLFDHSIHGQLEIWVMKEYGVKWSWTKEYVISRQVPGQEIDHFIPLRLMKNGELLIWYEYEGLGFYDPMKKEFRYLQIRGLPPSFEAITHVASLLPLRNAVGLAKSDGYNFSFGKWCLKLFPIPSHESIKYGDKQPTEHGLNPDGENEEDVQFSERPEERDRLQGEEGASNTNKMIDSFGALLNLSGKGMDTCSSKSRGFSVRGQGRGRGRGRGSETGSGRGRGKGRGRVKGRKI